jgi:hypothetical protein
MFFILGYFKDIGNALNSNKKGYISNSPTQKPLGVICFSIRYPIEKGLVDFHGSKNSN